MKGASKVCLMHEKELIVNKHLIPMAEYEEHKATCRIFHKFSVMTEVIRDIG